MEFGAEGDLEEPVDDLGVAEGLALDRAAMGDFGVFGGGEQSARQAGQRDQCRNAGTAEPAERHDQYRALMPPHGRIMAMDRRWCNAR